MDEKPVYFWYFTCARHCSFWQESTNLDGDPAWPTTCPYDGSRINMAEGSTPTPQP